MDDPWDVKSIRLSGQYLSCMKLNGVPLLPPVLSKECRKEMQYYRLLAREVEKRIECLKPLVIDRSLEDESENEIELNKLGCPMKLTQADVDMKLKISVTPRKPIESSLSKIPTPNAAKQTVLSSPLPNTASSRLIIDLKLNMNDTDQNDEEILASTPLKAQSALPIEIPEHDYDYEKITECDNTEHSENIKSFELESKKKLKLNIHKIDSFTDLPSFQEAPSSLTAKSFTGSLNNLHSNHKDIDSEPRLLRQSSYTVLTPSPQLLAHLQIQSLNTGVEMTSISMSESMSNLSSPNKKRRSWDLETAKVKWSSMALELKERNIKKKSTNTSAKISVNQKSNTKPPQTKSPVGTKSLYEDRTRHASLNKTATSQSVNKVKISSSPNRFKNMTSVTNDNTEQPSTQITKEVINNENPDSTTLSPVAEDPATKIRELYEKVQKQQLMQMANLVEKQKREQALLQQVFEEQNKLLIKQLKTICPKPPIEVKQAWEDKGPVSLKQLITDKPTDFSINSHLSSSTLIDTNKYIVHCENVLKKSKDLSSSIKKGQTVSPRNGEASSAGSRTRTHSPVNRKNTPASRKLNYDSSLSSDREYEAVLTDCTNDTFADLNVTFPSDHSDELQHDNTVINQVDPCNNKSIDNDIWNMEEKIIQSIDDTGSRQSSFHLRKTPSQLERAAASKIVAYARGYLVRRLMRTERVQSTVQTIKDALLCALQLHQEREGIKGADVDLHRRLIQQITAACYSLHDTFISSSADERCAMIAVDRNRRSLAALRASPRQQRPTGVMSQSHSGVFLKRASRPASSAMTQSNYETFSSSNKRAGGRYIPAPNRRPWR